MHPTSRVSSPRKPDSDQGICIICFDGTDQNKMSAGRCGHEFHEECIRRWVAGNNTCPTCRAVWDQEVDGYQPPPQPPHQAPAPQQQPIVLQLPVEPGFVAGVARGTLGGLRFTMDFLSPLYALLGEPHVGVLTVVATDEPGLLHRFVVGPASYAVGMLPGAVVDLVNLFRGRPTLHTLLLPEHIEDAALFVERMASFGITVVVGAVPMALGAVLGGAVGLLARIFQE